MNEYTNDPPPPYEEIAGSPSSSNENAHISTIDRDDSQNRTIVYHLVSRSATSRRWLNLSVGDTAKYRVLAPRMTQDQRPEVHLISLEDRKRVATAQIRRSTSAREFQFRLDASSSGSEYWNTVLVRGFSEWCFEFSCAGQEYSWVRTHDSELGASKLNGRSLKLLEGSYAVQKKRKKREAKEKAIESKNNPTQKVLMTYVHSPWFDLHAHDAGEIRIFHHDDRVCGEGIEHAGLITALGIQQREREERAETLRSLSRQSM